MSRKHRFLAAVSASIVFFSLLALFLPSSMAQAWSTDPTVSTGAAILIGHTPATLNGDLTDLGVADNVSLTFVWGTDAGGSYTQETAGRAMTSTGTFSTGLSGLVPAKTFYYRAKAQGDAIPVYGDEMSFTTSAAPNQSPNQPSNVTPANAAKGISLTPTLTASTFSDPDAGDTHAASQWQIRVYEGSYSSPVFDSGADTVNLTNIHVAAGSLVYAQFYSFHGYVTYYPNYYWHVRHQDSRGAWSDWSAETTFNTAMEPHASFFVASVKTLDGAMLVFFDNWSWGGVAPLTFAWDFETDGIVDSTECEPSHTYDNPGTYTVSLTMTDAVGDTRTKVEANFLTIIPFGGGRMETADGQISVEFPSGALAGTAVVAIRWGCQWLPGPPEGFEIVGNTCFGIVGLDENGSAILTLSQPAAVTVKYSDADLAAAGGDAENLVLAYCDRAVREEWKILDTIVDAAEMTLSISTTDLTSSMWGRGWGMWVVMVAPAGPQPQGVALWVWIVIGAGGVLGAGILAYLARSRMVAS